MTHTAQHNAKHHGVHNHQHLMKQARVIARLLDSSFKIPVINKRIGLDPLLGLMPVWGDVVSAAIGAYILWISFQLRLGWGTRARMLLNLLIDTAVGAFPIVGDLIDAAFKANTYNLKLLEEAYAAKYPESAIITVDAAKPAKKSRNLLFFPKKSAG